MNNSFNTSFQRALKLLRMEVRLGVLPTQRKTGKSARSFLQYIRSIERLLFWRSLTLSEACERLLCKAGLGLGKCGEGELARLERDGLCKEEALPMEEMEPRLDPCKEVAGEGGGVMKLYPGAALRRSLVGRTNYLGAVSILSTNLIIESNSAVAVFRSSVMSVSDVMRSERLEVELRWLQASTACCSSTGWIARATDKNCCLSTWLARSTASRSCSSKPCCSSSTLVTMMLLGFFW